MMRRAGNLYPRVIFALPASQPPSVRHSASSSGPAARWMAPSTPPPPSSVGLAALTMASTGSSVMSPRVSRMRPRVALIGAGPARPARVVGGLIEARVASSTSLMADESGVERAAVDAAERADHGRRQQATVRHADQMLGHPPQIALRGHPAGPAAIEPGEVHGQRIRVERPVAAQVHVALEVAHHQLAHRTVHGLAV